MKLGKHISYFKSFTRRDLVIIFILAIVYFISGKLGLQLAFLNPSATPVWPPTGISIAAILLFGSRIWPALLIGAFAVNITTAGTAATSLGIAIGNTLEGIVGAYLVSRFAGGVNVFERPVDIFKYIFLAGVLSTAVSASFGVTSLAFGGFAKWSGFFPVWLTWWLGDMAGALIIAPVFILWGKSLKVKWTLYQLLEISFLVLFISIIGQLVFGGLLPASFQNYPLAFLSIPVFVWIAFRFGPRETASAILILSAIAIFYTLKTLGPFVRDDPNESLLLLQVFMGTIFLAVMPLAAAIQEQKRLEEYLSESEEKYRKLLETSPDAILVTDLEADIEVVDKQTLIMYGFDSKEEMVGRSVFDLIVDSQYQEKTRKALQDLLRAGRVTNVEYVSVRKDGSKFFASSNASILFGGQQKPQAIIVVTRDITKEKEIDKMKTEFISLAAHQLRSPLGVMRWNIEMLLDTRFSKIPANIQKRIAAIGKSNQKMITLVNNFLSVSRIEQGKAHDKRNIVDLAETISLCVGELLGEAKKRSIEVSFKNDSNTSVKISADQDRLKEVITNILDNAIKYNKKNGHVEVKLERSNFQNIIRIADTGIGIPQKEQKSVFGKFFRAENALSSQEAGTGLGLVISKSYVERLGGMIEFISDEGKGTTFSIYLPSYRADAEEKNATIK